MDIYSCLDGKKVVPVERKGKRLKIVAARQNEMGMTAAGVLTMKMITLFKPPSDNVTASYISKRVRSLRMAPMMS